MGWPWSLVGQDAGPPAYQLSCAVSMEVESQPNSAYPFVMYVAVKHLVLGFVVYGILCTGTQLIPRDELEALSETQAYLTIQSRYGLFCPMPEGPCDIILNGGSLGGRESVSVLDANGCDKATIES